APRCTALSESTTSCLHSAFCVVSTRQRNLAQLQRHLCIRAESRRSRATVAPAALNRTGRSGVSVVTIQGFSPWGYRYSPGSLSRARSSDRYGVCPLVTERPEPA